MSSLDRLFLPASTGATTLNAPGARNRTRLAGRMDGMIGAHHHRGNSMPANWNERAGGRVATSPGGYPGSTLRRFFETRQTVIHGFNLDTSCCKPLLESPWGQPVSLRHALRFPQP